MNDISTNLVSFEYLPEAQRWNAVLNAITTEYTLTIKDMCVILKCSRNWINQYIKPHLHYIYLSRHYVQLANFILGRTENANTYYSKKEFEALIKSSITDISRRVIKVPVEELIRPGSEAEFRKQFLTTAKIRKLVQKDPDKYDQLLNKRDSIFREFATPKGLMLWDNFPNKYKRKETPFVPCTIDNLNIYQFISVADLKSYGDIDELIYRNLFIDGFIRLVLEIPDLNGVISQKIYYYEADVNEQTIELIPCKYVEYIAK